MVYYGRARHAWFVRGHWDRPLTRPPPEARPDVGRESYYRHGMRNVELRRGGRNQRRNRTGRYGDAPPTRGMPLSKVLEDPDASKAKSRTPKQAAQLARDNRPHGQRVYDSANAWDLRTRIDEATPSGLMGHEAGFGDDAIMMAKRCRAVCRRSFEISPDAGYNQWRPHRRMREGMHGANAPLEPLYGEYYADVAAYSERRRRMHQRLTSAKAAYEVDRKRRRVEADKKDDQEPT